MRRRVVCALQSRPCPRSAVTQVAGKSEGGAELDTPVAALRSVMGGNRLERCVYG
jgi:hypothetical protein